VALKAGNQSLVDALSGPTFECINPWGDPEPLMGEDALCDYRAARLETLAPNKMSVKIVTVPPQTIH
jgi:hypothetical protein